MNRKYFISGLIFLSFLSSFTFSGAGASLDWRGFYQEGNQYVIEIYTPQICALTFYWKEQNAQQGAYQLIGSLSKPNEGNLYQMRWDVSTLDDGNYTIFVQSSEGPELEQNVVVNRAHWEISPVILTYPGWVDAKYIGTIDGAVNSHPVGGTVSFYAQYFLYTKQSDNMFRISVDFIPDDVLKLIYKELYSHGAKWGTLHYQINDDTLEVRVIFPGYANYRPGPAPTESGSETPTPEPEESKDFKEIIEQLNQIQNQNQNLNQEVTNLHTKITEKDTNIDNLQEEIQNMKTEQETREREEQKRREEENKQFFLYVVVIAGGIGGIAAYAMAKRQTSYRPPPTRREFMGGKPFNIESTERGEVKIPALVILAAEKYNLDIQTLDSLVKRKKAEKPHLDTERALNLVLNDLKAKGES